MKLYVPRDGGSGGGCEGVEGGSGGGTMYQPVMNI